MAEQPDLPYVQEGLQPVAEPTNQFHYPEVPRSNAGSQLGQLAQALSRVSPQVMDLADAVHQKEVQDQQQQAAAYFAQNYAAMREKNRQGFMGLIKQGQLHFAQSPYAYEWLQKAVATAQANTVLSNIQQEWISDPSLRSDDLQPYKDRIRQRFGEALQGQDQVSAGVMGQVFAEAEPQLLTAAAHVQNEQRPAKMQAALEATIGQAFAPIDSHLHAMVQDHLTLPASTPDESQLGSPAAGTEPGEATNADKGSEQALFNSIDGQSSGQSGPPAELPLTSPEFEQERGYASQAFQRSVANAQQQLDNLGQNVPWPQANRMMAQALINLQETRGDAGLAETIARQLKTTDGHVLWDHLDIQNDIRQSSNDVLSQQVGMERLRQERMAIQQEQAKQQAYADATKAWYAANCPVDKPLPLFFNQKLLADPATAPGAAEALAALNSTWAQMQQAQDAKYSTKDYLDAVAKQAHGLMGLDYKSQQGFAALMDKLVAENKGSYAAQLSEDRRLQWAGLGGISNPQVMRSLTLNYAHGTLTEKMLEDAYANKTISTPDFNKFLGNLHANAPSLMPAMQDLEAKVKAQVMAEHRDTSIQQLLDQGYGNELDQREADTRLELYNQATALLNESNISGNDQTLKLSQLVDTVAKKYAKPIPPPPTPAPKGPIAPLGNPLSQRVDAIHKSQDYINDPDFAKMLGAPVSSFYVQPMGSLSRWFESSIAPNSGFGPDQPTAAEIPNLQGEPPMAEIANSVSGKKEPAFERWQTLSVNGKRQYLLGKLLAMRKQSTPDYDTEGWIADQLSRHFNRQRLLAMEADAPQTYARAMWAYQHGTLTPQLQNAARQAIHAQALLSQLDTLLPMPMSEAIKSRDSWQHVPLYATPKQLAEREDTDMSAFGLNPKDPTQKKLYDDAQMSQIERMRNGQ